MATLAWWVGSPRTGAGGWWTLPPLADEVTPLRAFDADNPVVEGALGRIAGE
jgi:hypothetical protein